MIVLLKLIFSLILPTKRKTSRNRSQFILILRATILEEQGMIANKSGVAEEKKKED